MQRGVERGSHIAGASIHNQRIERMWRDVFRCVCHHFYSIFYCLEDAAFLDPLDESDLFCLHYVFIPRIKYQLQQFLRAWNRHPLRTEGNRTPLSIWTEGIRDAILHPSNQDDVAVADGITSFGVDPLGPPSNHFDQGDVVIPAVNVQLSSRQMQTIQQQFHPLAYSNSNGVDIYIALRFVIHNVIL